MFRSKFQSNRASIALSCPCLQYSWRGRNTHAPEFLRSTALGDRFVLGAVALDVRHPDDGALQALLPVISLLDEDCRFWTNGQTAPFEETALPLQPKQRCLCDVAIDGGGFSWAKPTCVTTSWTNDDDLHRNALLRGMQPPVADARAERGVCVARQEQVERERHH